MPAVDRARFDSIVRVIAEVPEDFDLQDKLELRADLDVDSLGLIDIVVDLESEFDLTLSETALAQVKTVGQLYAEVVRATASGSEAASSA